MPNGDGALESWRKNAAQQWQDDRYTILWNELTQAYRHRKDNLFAGGLCEGLARAYALVTGDSVDSVHEMVARDAGRLVPS